MREFHRRGFLAGGGAGLLLSYAGGRLEAEEKAQGRDSRKIRVGQIGVGHSHATKLSVFRASPDYEVVGIVEPDPQLRARAASQPAFRDLKWMSREQLLASPGLELVLVETRVRDLLENAEACVSSGKHVHLDKPAGASLPRLRRLLDEASRRKLLVQTGYMFRYNPGVVLLRKMLAEGWLGDVVEVHALMSKVVVPDERRRLAEFHGGVMFELGCHVIDLVVGILGKPDAVVPSNRHAGRADDGLIDNSLAVFRYPRALASVTSNALDVDGSARRQLVVSGTGGTLQIRPLDNPSVRVALAKPHSGYRQGPQEIALPKYERYVDDAADIARVLRGEKASDFSYAHDLAVQETLLRACEMPLDV